MPPLKTQVSCPNCHLPIPATIEQVFDVTHDPTAKQRFLSGRFNIIQCPHCRYEGQIATPLLYHDADKELFLSYVPLELNLPPAEQEKALGRMMNEVINRLPPEKRKGYLLNPRPAITLEGMIERVLEGEGITREMREAQQAKWQLVQQLLDAPPEKLPDLVRQHDAEIDATFFHMVAVAIENRSRDGNRGTDEQALETYRRLLELSSFGTQLLKQRTAFEEVKRELEAAGERLTQDQLLEMILHVDSQEKLFAYANITRPAMDYAFFEALTRRIEQTTGKERERLTQIRESLLEFTQEIDRAMQARLATASELLRQLLTAPDPQATLEQNLPNIDDTFMAVLNANLQQAQRAGHQDLVARLEQLGEMILRLLQEKAPPEIRFINELLQMPDEADAHTTLRNRSAEITQPMIDAMTYIAENLRQDAQTQTAERLERLRDTAVGELMASNLRKATPPR